MFLPLVSLPPPTLYFDYTCHTCHTSPTPYTAIPVTAPTIQCVVLSGSPAFDPNMMTAAALSSTTKPLVLLNLAIYVSVWGGLGGYVCARGGGDVWRCGDVGVCGDVWACGDVW